MQARERYLNDPVFHALVQTMLKVFEAHCGSGAGITPSEIREASGLAWQMYYERTPAVFIRAAVD